MPKKYYTLKELAELTNTTLVGDPEYLISNVSDLENATPEDASFLANKRYIVTMSSSKAGVIFVTPDILLEKDKNYLVGDNPSLSFQKALEAFYMDFRRQTGFNGIHSTSVIHETAQLCDNVNVAPNAVIDKDAKIGDNTFIGAGCYIGANVSIGNDCLIHPNVTIRERCIIGDRVILQAGVVIGSCGYGYITEKDGSHKKLDQVGIVTIEDDVEIGANTTIDRSRFQSTVIGRGTKIDNLVMIGHSVKVGEDNLLVAQCGIAGSSQTGNRVILAGQTGLVGHIKLADDVVVAAKSGVSKSLDKAGKYNGIPAMPLEEFNRMKTYLKRIEKYANRIKNLEEKIAILEKEELASVK